MLFLGSHISARLPLFFASFCSVTTVIMAANLAPSFADLLAAELEFVSTSQCPPTISVQAALASFGAVFKKTCGDAHIADRAELLAGLALLHMHHLNLQPLVAALTVAQQLSLATALELDFQAFGTDASGATMLARRIVSKQAPGLTPKKRRPAKDGLDG